MIEKLEVLFFVIFVSIGGWDGLYKYVNVFFDLGV